MTSMRSCSALLFSAVTLMSLSCLQLTGGGTDTESGGVRVYGMLVDSAGMAMAGADVRLIPALYSPLSDRKQGVILSDTTDQRGGYMFSVRTSGVFNVQTKSPSGDLRSLLSSISIENRTISLPVDTLRKMGTISVLLPGVPDTGASFVYIPGTTYCGRVARGSVVLDSVPAGFIPALYFTDLAAASPIRVIKVGPTVTAGDTTVIADYFAWKYSQKLYLNTTPAGADVAGDVYNFPVCVRLSLSNFTFSEAAAEGRDIRFTKSDGSPLPHQVEQWNAAARDAAMWVLIDTVHGSSEDQYIIMHWGNSLAPDASNGQAVFDTAKGFGAVWHMADSGQEFRDATANGYSGISGSAGLTSPVPADGMVGVGQQCNGTTSGIVIPNSGIGKLDFPFNGSFTLSAWVFFSTLDTAYHPIICKGDDQYGLQIKDSSRWEIFVYQKDVYDCARMPAVSGSWKYITGVRDSDKISLYIDGVLASDSLIELPWPPKDTTRSVFIGAYPSRKRFWNGFLDEIRIQNRVVNGSWIRLCYMNQRRDDKLVLFPNRQ